MEVVLGDIAHLQAFCIDHFPKVMGETVAGMRRVNIVNLLFEQHDPSEIWRALQKHHPEEVKGNEGLIEWEEPRPEGKAPRYRDEVSRRLAEELSEEQARKKRLEKLGAPVDDVSHRIVVLKRKLREGMSLREGDVLGRYTLWERIGQGGFATVWKAVEEETESVVAIKVLHPTLAGDPLRVDRFFRGARMMAALDHPAIVKILAPRGEDDGVYFFVMEYIEGGDLHHAVLARRVLPEHVLPMILAVGEGLGLAHERGWVHRDVKPANILLGLDGVPKLTDFDLVGAAETTGGTRTGALGTFVYAAPEAMEKPQDADARADVFGLAMTMVFALYGKPLPLAAFRHPDTFVDRLMCDEVDKQVLKQALDWEREQRHRDAQAFCSVLRGPWREGSDALGRYAILEVHGVKQTMRWIPPGKFLMGSPESEAERWSDEGPQHEVTLTDGYWLADTPCTQALWEAVMGSNPSWFKGPDQPVDRVSWDDCKAFLNKLEALTPGLRMRLPTEAEWERACRGGTTGARWADQLNGIAWHHENARGETHPVKGKLPNPFGLYDMLGNVWEWCEDGQRPYTNNAVVNPRGPMAGSQRVFRGGSWDSRARYVRAAGRYASDPAYRSEDLGFRIARGQ